MIGWTRFDNSHAAGEKNRRLATEPLNPGKKFDRLIAELIAENRDAQRQRVKPIRNARTPGSSVGQRGTGSGHLVSSA